MGKIILVISMVFVSFYASAQNEKQLVKKGNDLYKQRQFEKAAEQYEKAAKVNEKNPTAQYNLGNALYKSKKTEAAEKSYASAAENSKNPAAKSKATYNKGVSLTRQNKLMESINAYKDALRLNPTDEEARQNLQKALNELKKQQQNQSNNDKSKKNKSDNKEKPQQEKNNSKLNKKQVEQMLNALRQDEKKLQQNIQKKNNSGTPNQKDW